jgi:hypothetical protein
MTSINLECPKCKCKMWHITIKDDGYHNECWKCGHVVQFSANLSVSGKKEEGFLDLPALTNPASTWHVVITDLIAGGDHDSSPHGLTLGKAIEWMQRWFFERSYGVSSVEKIDLHWSPVQEHPFTSKRYVDGMCQNEGTAPHDEFGNLLATLWED